MPMLRLLIPLVLGILSYQPGRYYPLLIALGILAASFRFIKTPLRTRLIKKGIALSLLVFSTGYGLSYMNDVRNHSHWFESVPATAYILRIKTHPSAGKYYNSAIAEIQYLKHKEQWIPAIGNITVQWSKKDRLSLNSVLYTAQIPLGISDTGSRRSYARYLANQQIYHQLKLKKYILLEQPILKESFIEKAQRITLSILNLYFTDPIIRGLAKALLVGYRGELDKTLNTAYVQTGVVHVIAISGLHLGLIYGLLMLLFKPLQHQKALRILTSIIVMILLWIFTLMCGASPSVVRSAIMFSFFIVGKIIQSKPSTGNMLAASAWVMLCYDPLLLYDIGFQLSYAAVGSLLLYTKPISALYQPENGWLHLGWSSMSTSLAAQVLTTPFVLFHFHQFPLLFLLANIVAIPLSSLALLLLILLCLFSTWAWMARFIAEIADKVMWLMNDRIMELAALPFARLNNISFNHIDLLFSLICIGCLTIYLNNKLVLALKAFLSTVLLWSILNLFSS